MHLFRNRGNYIIKLALLFIIIASWGVSGCRYNSEEQLFGVKGPCDTTNVTYSVTINGILSANTCLACHVGPAPAGNFALTSYADVKNKVSDGTLWGAINHLPGFSPMPQGGNKLTQCEIDKIKTWIEAGAPQN
jgi:hypothetical protein